jgi:hypothetical protein
MSDEKSELVANVDPHPSATKLPERRDAPPLLGEVLSSIRTSILRQNEYMERIAIASEKAAKRLGCLIAMGVSGAVVLIVLVIVLVVLGGS